MDYKKLICGLLEKNDARALSDAVDVCREYEKLNHSVIYDKTGKSTIQYDEDSFLNAHAMMRKVCAESRNLLTGKDAGIAADVLKASLLFEAPYSFDEFMQYVEFERDAKSKFYIPRRNQLKPLVDAMQKLEDGEITTLLISLPPRIGKTTLAEFFMSWTSGKHPELSCLIGSHDNAILRGMHSEIYRMFVDSEYLWHDVFPDVPFQKKDVEGMRLNLGKEKRFETLMFASIKGGAAGKYTATNILYCDDLVESLEQAMSPARMDNLWNAYSVDLRQRKQGTCKELHIATRWSLNDVLGRIERRCGNSDKTLIINVPALNEDGESNFDYPYNLGFTTAAYNDLRDGMDDASWRALYMGEPVERKGQLYPPDELRRYFTLPEGEPDAIISVCDTKDTGEDYAVMPVAYVYGSDYYIEDILCDNGRPDAIDIRLADKLCDHKVKMARFESNRGGSRCAETVEKYVNERNGITHITTKWNQTNKETRILMSQPWVRKHCLFKDESLYVHNKEYRIAMNMLCGYTMMGKNEHDDVPDAFSSLSDFATSFVGNTVVVAKRMF